MLRKEAAALSDLEVTSQVEQGVFAKTHLALMGF